MKSLLNSRLWSFCFLSFACFAASAADKPVTRNVILVTFDGLRWQEVFGGADATLLNKESGGVKDVDGLRKQFWRDTPEERRTALMPFLWNTVARQGQIFGNTNRGSVVKVSNGLNFSYPGYNEILTGSPDPRIDSNAKRPNPNVTVLEWLNAKPAYHDKVAAFCAWDVFPFILNRERSGLQVWSAWEMPPESAGNPRLKVMRELLQDTTPVWDIESPDSFVLQLALDHLEHQKPRVLYVSFGETDEWAHEGRYDLVLHAAHRMDGGLQRLWDQAQSMPEYRGRTTLLVTTDHGRGGGLKEWKNHGQKVAGAEYIWMAALGPDTPVKGERHDCEPLTQSQMAATVAALLGEDYNAVTPKAAQPVRDFLP